MHEHIESKWSIIIDLPTIKSYLQKTAPKIDPFLYIAYSTSKVLVLCGIKIHFHQHRDKCRLNGLGNDNYCLFIVYINYYYTSDALSYLYLASTGNPPCPGERDINERIQQSHQLHTSLYLARCPTVCLPTQVQATTFTISFVVGRKIQITSLSCIPLAKERVDAVTIKNAPGNHFVDNRLVS